LTISSNYYCTTTLNEEPGVRFAPLCS